MEGEGEATHNKTSTMDTVHDKSGHVKSAYSQKQRSKGVADAEVGTRELAHQGTKWRDDPT